MTALAARHGWATHQTFQPPSSRPVVFLASAARAAPEPVRLIGANIPVRWLLTRRIVERRASHSLGCTLRKAAACAGYRRVLVWWCTVLPASRVPCYQTQVAAAAALPELVAQEAHQVIAQARRDRLRPCRATLWTACRHVILSRLRWRHRLLVRAYRTIVACQVGGRSGRASAVAAHDSLLLRR
jgi:hypothetical protein